MPDPAAFTQMAAALVQKAYVLADIRIGPREPNLAPIELGMKLEVPWRFLSATDDVRSMQMSPMLFCCVPTTRKSDWPFQKQFLSLRWQQHPDMRLT